MRVPFPRLPRPRWSCRVARARAVVGASFVAACASLLACATTPETGGDEGDLAASASGVEVALDALVGETAAEYLSVAIDASQAFGGNWWSPSGAAEGVKGSSRVTPYDFSRPKLLALAKALAPAYLRIGGTEADDIYYDVADAPARALPEKFGLRLTRALWDGVNRFVADTGLRLMFTVNAGPGPRDASGRWTSTNFEQLLAYTDARRYHVDVWELGNETNAFWLSHGPSTQLDGEQYARDYRAMRAALQAHGSRARAAGPAAVFWPHYGEIPRNILLQGITGDFLEHAGSEVDLVTWHYYPTQSKRCTKVPFVRPVPAGPKVLLQTRNLDSGGELADGVAALVKRSSPGAEMWLGETGPAQCGGEPGVSDTFASSLWWMDQLGLMARKGQKVSVRQALSGADYGLVDDATLEPLPDYWGSILWKRLMGRRVLDAHVGSSAGVRAYAHCAGEGAAAATRAGAVPPGAVTVLLVNESEGFASPKLTSFAGQEAHVFAVTADQLLSRVVSLNGKALRVAANGALPLLEGEPVTLPADGELRLAPTSYAFVVLPSAASRACSLGNDRSDGGSGGVAKSADAGAEADPSAGADVERELPPDQRQESAPSRRIASDASTISRSAPAPPGSHEGCSASPSRSARGASGATALVLFGFFGLLASRRASRRT